MNGLSYFVGALMVFVAMISDAMALTANEYKVELGRYNVILSANDEEMVMEWLASRNSGYPDLADGLLVLLNNSRPKGNSAVLDGIMGKYKIINGRAEDFYIPPPYNSDQIKHAYTKNWRDRNSGPFRMMRGCNNGDYDCAFRNIVSPLVPSWF